MVISMRIVNEIIGKEVLDSSAIIIGKVKDVEIDAEFNTIESLVLNKGGLTQGLGLSKGETIVPVDRVRKIGDKILLKDIDEL